MDLSFELSVDRNDGVTMKDKCDGNNTVWNSMELSVSWMYLVILRKYIQDIIALCVTAMACV